MKPEEINVAIALSVGYAKYPDNSKFYESPDKQPVHYLEMPEYSEDLNAMHEAEKVLTPEQCSIYERSLARIIGEVTLMKDGAKAWYWHATAPQRCEALLKTLGKWVETKGDGG